MPRLKAVLLDFDGVLADSFDPLYRLNVYALGRVGVSLSRAGYRRLFEGNVHRSVRSLLPNPRAQRYCRNLKARNFGKYYSGVKLFRFAPPLVRRLSREFQLAIVSSTPERFIRNKLSREGLSGCFRAIYGSRAESKSGEMLRAMRFCGASPAETIFVTDTIGDIVTARKLGVKSLAVGWGFQEESRLKSAKPFRLVKTPRELRHEFTKITGGV